MRQTASTEVRPLAIGLKEHIEHTQSHLSDLERELTLFQNLEEVLPTAELTTFYPGGPVLPIDDSALSKADTLHVSLVGTLGGMETSLVPAVRFSSLMKGAPQKLIICATTTITVDRLIPLLEEKDPELFQRLVSFVVGECIERRKAHDEEKKKQQAEKFPKTDQY